MTSGGLLWQEGAVESAHMGSAFPGHQTRQVFMASRPRLARCAIRLIRARLDGGSYSNDNPSRSIGG